MANPIAHIIWLIRWLIDPSYVRAETVRARAVRRAERELCYKP